MKIAMYLIIMLIAFAISAPADAVETKIVGPGIKLAKIPGGTFQMGSKDSEDEQPIHTVTVNSFWMGETEVTTAQYVAFLQESQPATSDRKRWIAINGEKSWYYTGKDWDIAVTSNSHISYSAGKYTIDAGWEDHPVVNVSWYGADAFCSYYKLRLPTEAEWEYAAGGPSHYKYPWGDEFDKNACCYRDNRGSGSPPTMSAGSFPANGYGLYDMAGNVSEWCHDWYGAFSDIDSINPQGPGTGKDRVYCGGSWGFGEDFQRCAFRDLDAPADMNDNCGFRVAGD
jgi:formylglycine-generating enzyme required for sulfatase activity